MKLRLNISTCPNDTFMFYALIHGKIDTKGYKFDVSLEDIDMLNKQVSEDSDCDISKISYAHYPNITESYKLLRSGSAMGSGNGPLLVSKHKIYPDEIPSLTIAIPGENTSANFLLNFVSPSIKQKKVYLFSDVSEAILTGEVDAGVLIHEERFSYPSKGLKLVLDLGEYWQQKSGSLIPLGAIVINRKLETGIQSDINYLVAESIRYAYKNPGESQRFIREHARELSDEVIEKHIKMFVNEYSLDITEYGISSVLKFFKSSGIELTEDIFVDIGVK